MFIKIRPVETELFYADRQTDGQMDGETDIAKLIVACWNFANASINNRGTGQ
jgi:hypothetical protein